MKRIFSLTAPAMICASLIMPVHGQTVSDHDRAKSLLAGAMKAKNPGTRKESVKALRLVGGQEHFATRLEAMLNDKDVEVRMAVIEVLAALKTERAIAALKTAMNDRVAEVRFAAATALFKLDDPAGREFLMGVLSGETKISSGIAAVQMREAKRTIETPNALMMVVVKQGAGLAPVPGLGAGLSATEKIMAHRKLSSRAATALLLGKDKDPGVVAMLRKALTDKDPSVRAAAVQALSLVDDQDAAPLFVLMFNDKNQAVRLRAAAGYLRLGNGAPTSALDVVEE
jgi:HEAT repeat protein